MNYFIYNKIRKCFNKRRLAKVRLSDEMAELNKKIEEWLAWDQNEHTLSAIKHLVEEKQFDKLEKILLDRLSFGTAGLRGRMEAGYAAMNDLVIIQTAQGLLKYLEDSDRKLLSQNGIVIGFDGRHNSKRFAELTASIFLHAGYPVKLFSQVVPTPFVPFAVAKYSTAIGVMVTASHNPKEDNGYKVYGPNSAQIVSPVDKLIQKSILENLEPLATSWNTSILLNSKLLNDPLEEIVADYLQVISETLLPEHKILNEKSAVLFTYTAMHGVGFNYIQKVFNAIGAKLVAVEAQRDPHPDFPTVKFPNPEEGKSSLDLSIKTANENGSSVIIANDPDADRMAAAEKNLQTGEWKVFTGNELGALLGWWSLYCFKQKYPKKSLKNVYMLSSTVSSMILRSMAKKEGFNFIETLTGFKWMGNKMHDLINKEGKEPIFAFEEAIGYCCGSAVLDKDGVSAAFQLATLTCFLKEQNLSLCDKLEEIYAEYGFHVSLNSYFICHDGEKIKRIFERIRQLGGENKYPSGILENKYKISTVRDLTTGFDSSQADNKAILPISKSSQMITFNFDNGLVCTLRTSGTEPKIKYYTEMCAAPGDLDRERIKKTLHEMVNAVIEECFQPTQNELIPKSD